MSKILICLLYLKSSIFIPQVWLKQIWESIFCANESITTKNYCEWLIILWGPPIDLYSGKGNLQIRSLQFEKMTHFSLYSLVKPGQLNYWMVMDQAPISFNTSVSVLLSASKHAFNIKIKKILTGNKSANELDLGDHSTIYLYI